MADEQEIDVDLVLGSEGVSAPMDSIVRSVGLIQAKIDEIVKSSNLGVTDFDEKIRQQVKFLQAALGQIDSMAKALASGGVNKLDVVGANAEKAFAKATISATKFAKEIHSAETAAEGLEARLNTIQKKISSGVSSRGGLASAKDVRAEEHLKEQLTLLKRLDAEQAKLEARALRTKNSVPTANFSGDQKRAKGARDALEAAILNPRRANFDPEIKALQEAQAAYNTSLDGTRSKKADNLRMAREEAAEIKVMAKLASDADRAHAVVAAERAAQEKKMWAAQEAHEVAAAAKAKTAMAQQLSLNDARLKREADADKARLDAIDAAVKARRKEEADSVAAAEKAEALSHRAAKATAPYDVKQSVELEGLDTIREASAARLAAAYRAVAAAQGLEKDEALKVLATEKAISAEVTRQVRANEREDKQNAPRPPKSLLPGGIGHVIANTVAYSAVGGGIFAVVGALETGIAAAVEFQDKLAQIQAITGATSGQMKNLSKAIEEVGSHSRFSLDELAGAAEELAKLGLSADAVKNTLPSINNLALATGSTLSEAVQATTATMAAFNLSVEDSKRVSDILAAGLNKSRLTITEFNTAVQTIGPAAAAVNISVEEMIAAMGAMSDAGLKGTRATQGLRQTIMAFTEPTKKLSDELRKLGITFEDIDISTKGLPAVLETLKEKGFGVSEAYGSLDKRAAGAFLTLENNVPKMRELSLSMEDVGAATAAAAVRTRTLATEWQSFKNNLSAGTYSLVDSLGLTGLLKGLNDAYDKVQFINDYNAKHRVVNETYSTRVDAENAYEDYKKSAEAVDQYNKKLAESKDHAKTSTDAFEAQRSKLESLDEAIQRIVGRQSSLKDNSSALNVETGTMIRQFEGLASHLDSTKESFQGLLGAAQAYRQEQLQLLQSTAAMEANSFANEESILHNQAAHQYLEIQNKYAAARSGTLRQQLDSAYKFPNDPVARGKLTDSANTEKDAGLKQAILDLLTTSSARAGAVVLRANSTDNAAQAGVALTKPMIDLSNKISALTNSTTDHGTVTSMITQIQNMEKGNNSKPQQEVLSGFIEKLQGLLSKPGELAAPTAHRDHGRTPLAPEVAEMLRSEYDGANVYGTQARSLTEQTQLYNAYKAGRGPLAARPGTSNHGTQHAVDMTPRNDVSMEEVADFLESKGLYITEKLNEKDPKTGKTHWHFGWKTKPSAFDRREGRAAAKSEAYDTTLDGYDTHLADKDLKSEMKTLSESTTIATYDAQTKVAEEAFKKWKESFTTLTTEQMKKEGINPNGAQGKRRLEQMKETIDDRMNDFTDNAADALIKTLDAMGKEAELQFKLSTDAAVSRAASAKATLKGLDSPRLAGTVPDYVKTLAQQRSEHADEASQRSELSGKNNEISAKENILGQAQKTMNAYQLAGVEATDGKMIKITKNVEELTVALDKLKKERDDLSRELEAKGLIPTTFTQGFHQAIDAIKGSADFGQNIKQVLIGDIGTSINSVKTGMEGFFSTMIEGSTSAGQAFKTMARGIIDQMAQMALKAAVDQIFKLIISSVSAGGGGGFDASSPGAAVAGSSFAFTGGEIGKLPIQGFSTGGEVMNGSASHDSVMTKLAKGEFVVRKSAVDSVGSDFMAKLNRQGSQALKSVQEAPTLVGVAPKQEMKVFVVAPTAAPSMSPHDVLLTISDDLLKGGVTQQLVKHIAQGQ